MTTNRLLSGLVAASALGFTAFAGCTPAIPEGRIACTEATMAADCPPGWFCRVNRCFSTADGVDAGPIDTGPGTDTGPTPDTGPADGGSDVCIDDLDCSDGVFCNGDEICDETDPGADPVTGCLPPDDVACLPTQTCDEDTAACLSDCDVDPDADNDTHDDTACGGDDCDDADADTFPGHAEVCDDVDNDCNPATFGTTDADGDLEVSDVCCNAATCGTDCDDSQASVRGGGTELCDGLDNDCDGTNDDGVLVTYYYDRDGDNYGVAGMTMQACAAPADYVAMSGDCDDAAPARNPGATETCNAIDDDCDTVVDDGLSCACTGTMTQTCGSMVGACTAGTQICSGGMWGTCTGGSGPGAETCNNTDDDCNGTVDDGAASTGCATRPNTTRTCAGGACAYSCTGTFQTCDSAMPGDASGCESNSLTDVLHCGGCAACTADSTVATSACSGGTCNVAACRGGLGDCDGSYSNGCETAVNTVTNCGTCGVVCPRPPNATQVCGAGGVCGYTCTVGNSDCDGSGANGCETPLGTCNVPPPRLIGPLTAMVVTSNRPELRFLPLPGTTEAHIDVCRDPTCSSAPAWSGDGTSPLTVGAALAPGRYYWRAYGRAGTTNGTTASAVWNFVVFARSAPPVATTAFPFLNVAGGNEDIAFGEPSSSPPGGSVRFFDAGGSTLTQMITAPAGTTNFGSSISSVDVNGDGYGDLIVGACVGNADPATAPAATNCSNRVFVYAGTPAGNFIGGAPYATLMGGTFLGFGYSVAGLGDVNGDGYGDFIVGSYWANAASLFLGAASAAPIRVDLFPNGTDPGDGRAFGLYGFSVAAAGDVDGDHFDDILVGSASNNSDSYLYYGGSGGIGTSFSRIQATSISGTGVSFSGIGDANGDGRADFARGRPGSLTAFFGTSSRPAALLAAGSWQLTGSTYFGTSVIGPGDMDGDGYCDVSVSTTGGGPALVETFYGAAGGFMWQYSTSTVPGFGMSIGRGGTGTGGLGVVAVGTCWGAAGGGSCGMTASTFAGSTSPPTQLASWSGSGSFSAGMPR